MTTAMAMPCNTAATFLTHFFGPGLAGDDRYVVERFRTMADGDIRRCPDAAPKGIDFPEEGGPGRRFAHGGERTVHRPEARTAVVAQRGDEAAVPVHGGAERPGAHPLSGAPDLDRPQKPGIEDAAGI